jgi:hypothetical protein
VVGTRKRESFDRDWGFLKVGFGGGAARFVSSRLFQSANILSRWFSMNRPVWSFVQVCLHILYSHILCKY